MIFRQITHDDLGCASYLIGDEDAGVAAVVDPRFEVDEYLELARYMGVSIEHVLEDGLDGTCGDIDGHADQRTRALSAKRSSGTPAIAPRSAASV